MVALWNKADHYIFMLWFLLSLPAALRAAQACRYLIYSEADFEVFHPAGATRCTDGGEIWHGGNFTPIGAMRRV